MIRLGLVAGVFLLWLYSHPWGVVVGVALLAYLVHCTIKPRHDCWPFPFGCGGNYKRRGTVATGSFHLCPVCHGRGQRVRWGARIWRRNRHLFDRPSAAAAAHRDTDDEE